MKELLLASTVLSGAFIFSSAANAAPCVVNANGTFTVNTAIIKTDVLYHLSKI